MKHYEFLKLTPDADVVEVQQKVWKAYKKLDEELDWLNLPVVYRSCREGDDADIMAVVDIEREELLETYLKHPLYAELVAKLEKVVVKRSAFDHY